MLIGIQSSSGARSGKDSVATMLQDYLVDTGRYAFASPIKTSINELFSWDERHSDGVLKEIVLPTFFPSDEQWQDVIGDFYRKHSELYNLSTCVEKAFEIATVFNTWCFDNNRVVQCLDYNSDHFGNELIHISPREMYQLFGTEMMRECISDSFWTDIAPTENVIITDVRFKNEVEWLYENNGTLIDVQRPNNQVKVASHSSEAGTGVDADYIIVNDGTLEQLEDEVDKLATILKERYSEW